MATRSNETTNGWNGRTTAPEPRRTPWSAPTTGRSSRLGAGIAAAFDLDEPPAAVEDTALAIRRAVPRYFDRSPDLGDSPSSEDGDRVALTAAERHRFRGPLAPSRCRR